MDIVKLPAGQAASPDSDCIRIQELPDGGFILTGTVLRACGDDEPSESVALIGGKPYPSYDDAEAAGTTWASELCAEVLYVSCSDGTAPLPDIA